MSEALLRVEDAGREREVVKVRGSLTIGRSTRSDLVLRDAAASRRHAELRELSPGHFVLLAFNSRNGTFLNGRRVTGMHKLVHGDVIRIGKYRLSLELKDAPTHSVFSTDSTGIQTAAGFQDGYAVILMSDIRNYTAMTARFSGHHFQALLSKWFEMVIGVLEPQGATIDKIMGDALMAYWFSSEEQECRVNVGRAIKSASAMVELMYAHETTVKKQFPEADFRIGIGLNAGPVALGNIGTAVHQAMTVVGDCVNLTARLEALCKRTGRLAVAGADFVRMAPEAAVFVDLGEAMVDGRDEPLAIHALAIE